MEFSEDQVKKAIKNGQITISVIGLGRIGLPTAVLFAESGANVIGVDIDPKLIELLKDGKNELDEPSLDELIKKNIKNGKLKISLDLKFTIKNSQVIIICVPTSINKNHSANYSIIKKVIEDLSGIIIPNQIIIIESTISPGMVENYMIPVLERGSKLKCGKDFFIASCPERANPGNIIKTFKNTPRIIGGITQKCTNIASAIYSSVIDSEIIKTTNPKTANAVKLTENIFRDINIALMNELAILYEKLEINIFDVIKASSTKWNFIPHYPGPGVGGSCLPVNPYYLIDEAKKVGYELNLILMAREINEQMPEHIVQLIGKSLEIAKKSIKNSNICILGLSYKPDIKDIQLSPAISIINKLKHLEAKIRLFDPYFKNQNILDIKVNSSLENAVKDADCLVIVTKHKLISNINLQNIQKLTKSPLIIVDGRKTFNSENLPNKTIYQCVGCPLIIS